MTASILRSLLLAALAATWNAQAQGVRTEQTIGLQLATHAASAAIEQCVRQGYAVAAAVVDRSGQVRALLRSDGASPHTVDSSRRKAYTAVALRLDTSEALAIVRKNPEARHLGDIEGFLILGGGVPIRHGNEVIGAIGVAGAPGANLDENCARAGIAAITERLK